MRVYTRVEGQRVPVAKPTGDAKGEKKIITNKHAVGLKSEKLYFIRFRSIVAVRDNTTSVIMSIVNVTDANEKK